MTIEAWVKFESLGSNTIVSKFDDGGVDERSYLLMYANGAGLQFSVSDNGTDANKTVGSVTFSPSTGGWYHIATVYNASAGSVDFYVNGVQQGSTQTGLKTSIYNGTAKFQIGARNGTPTSFFDGLIDDVRIWNIAKTATEIADDRSRELNGNETGLVGYWKLNSADLMGDYTANNNDLTNNGTAVSSASTPFTSSAESLKVRKSSNESVTSSVTMQNDDHLKLVLLENKTYIIDGVIFASSTSATPDIKIAFFAPTGSTITIGYTNDVNEMVLASGATSSAIALPANTPTSIHVKGTVKTTSTSGDFQLKWAQSQSSASPTTVMEGSYLRAESI